MDGSVLKIPNLKKKCTKAMAGSGDENFIEHTDKVTSRVPTPGAQTSTPVANNRVKPNRNQMLCLLLSELDMKTN